MNRFIKKAVNESSTKYVYVMSVYSNGPIRFVPRNVPGDFLKGRIDEWHLRNLGRFRTNGYAVRITSDLVASPQTLRAVPQSHFEATATAGTSNSGHYVHNRITSIEHHLFQLRNHKTDIGNNAQSSSHPSDWHMTRNQPSSHCA